MGTRRTDPEVRTTHRALIVCGVLLGLAGLVLNLLPLFAGSVAFGAAAQTGYLLAVLLIGGTLVHRWWYFGPTRSFRRELGGPDGWLDRHDLARTAGAGGVRAAAPPGSGSGPHAPVTAYGWRVGHLVSGSLRVRYRWRPRAVGPAHHPRRVRGRRRARIALHLPHPDAGAGGAGHTISAMPRWHAYVLGLGRHPAVVVYEPGYARVAREHAALDEPATAGPVPDPRVGQVVPMPTRAPRR